MGNNILTKQQDAFAYDIANKTYKFAWEAYAANYNIKKMSQNAIYVEACRLRSNPKVALRIAELEKKIRDKEKLTLDEVIVRLSKRNEVTAKDYLNEDGTFKLISELTDDQAVFITGFKVHELYGKGDFSQELIGRIIDIKIESFKDIMDMLIRHHGGYAKDKEDSANNLEAIRDIIETIKK